MKTDISLQQRICRMAQARHNYLMTGFFLERMAFEKDYRALWRITQDYSQRIDVREEALRAMHRLSLEE